MLAKRSRWWVQCSPDFTNRPKINGTVISQTDNFLNRRVDTETVIGACGTGDLAPINNHLIEEKSFVDQHPPMTIGRGDIL